MMYPLLECILQHWYELREGPRFDEDNRQRFRDIKSLGVFLRRNGKQALRGRILNAMSGKAVADPCYLPVGAALFPDELSIETYVRRSIRGQKQNYRLAAVYASVYFLDRSKELSSLLSERVLLAEEDKVTVQAAREALAIWYDTRDGGRCQRCGLMGGSPSTQRQPVLTVRPVSLK